MSAPSRVGKGDAVQSLAGRMATDHALQRFLVLNGLGRMSR